MGVTLNVGGSATMCRRLQGKGTVMGRLAFGTFFVLMLASFAGGCAARVDGAPSGDDGGLLGEDVGSTASALTGPTEFFQSYVYGSNNGRQTERFVECSPDQVMTGFGGRVINDNFTDVSIYCRSILYSGALSVNESWYYSGGTAQEQQIHADNGSVVVGLGGVVHNDNVYKLVIRQCPWIASSKRVDIYNCNYKSSYLDTTTENFFDAQSGYSASQKPRVVGAGAGMTSTNDNLFTVGMTIGLLK